MKPVISVASGDTVTVECVSGPPEMLPEGSGFHVPPELHAIHARLTPAFGGGHILTGPIALEGAEPGDTLEVRIHAIDFRQNWGYSRIAPLRGTLPEDFPTRKTWHTPIHPHPAAATTPSAIDTPPAPSFP